MADAMCHNLQLTGPQTILEQVWFSESLDNWANVFDPFPVERLEKAIKLLGWALLGRPMIESRVIFDFVRGNRQFWVENHLRIWGETGASSVHPNRVEIRVLEQLVDPEIVESRPRRGNVLVHMHLDTYNKMMDTRIRDHFRPALTWIQARLLAVCAHEMIHALFQMYGCRCGLCMERGSNNGGTGHNAHWQRVAYRMELYMAARLGIITELGRGESMATQMYMTHDVTILEQAARFGLDRDQVLLEYQALRLKMDLKEAGNQADKL